MFPFKNEQDLYHSRELRRYYKKLYTSLNASVDSLKDPSMNINQILKNLGKRLLDHGVQRQHYNIFGRALISTLIENLGASYTPEIENAWVLFFVQTTNSMVSTHYDQPRVDYINITDEQKAIIKESWVDAKDLGYDAIGLALIKHIFRLRPDSL